MASIKTLTVRAYFKILTIDAVILTATVNMVIFAEGKFRRDISCGGNFHDSTLISFIKAYGFYFRMEVIFAKKSKARKKKNTKTTPTRNFHAYNLLSSAHVISFLVFKRRSVLKDIDGLKIFMMPALSRDSYRDNFERCLSYSCTSVVVKLYYQSYHRQHNYMFLEHSGLVI